MSFVDRVRESAARYASLTLAELADGVTITVDPELAREAGAAGAEALRELRQDLIRWLRRRNQFVSVDADGEAELDAGLESLAVELADAEPEDQQDIVDEHLERFVDFVRARLGPRPRDVVAGEYSAELQLEVLGLRLSAVEPPVLDVGCGGGAVLVRSLRARGLDAFGIDQGGLDRDTGREVATLADWLTFDYGVSRWGTVVSHLGFSLHFLHQHHAAGEGARRYAEAYLRILRSLRPGGVFAYAPSLPFFEAVLPKEGLLITHARVRATETLSSLSRSSGLALAESTVVRRVG